MARSWNQHHLQLKNSATETCVHFTLPITAELETMQIRPGVLAIFLGVMFSSVHVLKLSFTAEKT
jgi:hypothetical protein